MSSHASRVEINVRPSIVDTIHLRNVQLVLPAAPDAWHRPAHSQPCMAAVRLSYASCEASANADDVGLTIDYGKLYRCIVRDLNQLGEGRDVASLISAGARIVNLNAVHLGDTVRGAVGEDIRLTAGIIANCCLQQLKETSLRAASITNHAFPPAVDQDFGRFQIHLGFPKAILRAEGGLEYRSITELGHVPGDDSTSQNYHQLVVLEEEFRIEQIRSYCILGINSHERVEKQAVLTSLHFQGPALQPWSNRFIDTYQEMTRVVAERIETTLFGSVEALATLVARIVTMEFDHDEVTVLVEKPSALGFVHGSGLECKRSRAYFEKRS